MAKKTPATPAEDEKPALTEDEARAHLGNTLSIEGRYVGWNYCYVGTLLEVLPPQPKVGAALRLSVRDDFQEVTVPLHSVRKTSLRVSSDGPRKGATRA